MAHSFVGADNVETLRRENSALNQKLNYMMNSIKSFWSPELKNERQQRKEETLRLANFQEKIMQQAVSPKIIIFISHLFRRKSSKFAMSWNAEKKILDNCCPIPT
jgi:hypothetical protein